MVSESIFVPFARRMGAPGALVEQVAYGCFHVTWEVRKASADPRTVTEFPPEIRVQALHRKGWSLKGSIVISS